MQLYRVRAEVLTTPGLAIGVPYQQLSFNFTVEFIYIG